MRCAPVDLGPIRLVVWTSFIAVALCLSDYYIRLHSPSSIVGMSIPRDCLFASSLIERSKATETDCVRLSGHELSISQFICPSFEVQAYGILKIMAQSGLAES